MTHCVLLPGTKVRVIDGTMTKQVRVDELVGEDATVYDFFGRVHTLTVEPGTVERRYLMSSTTGERIQFGEGHTVLTRKYDSAEYKRVAVSDLFPPGFVRLPQKKVVPPEGVADMLDYDDKTRVTHVTADNIKDLIFAYEAVASCGVTVSRHPTKLRFDIDPKRPVCFATKLLNGNFQADMVYTLNQLAMSGIVIPCRMFNDTVIKETSLSGIIFEGNNIFNDVPISRLNTIDKPSDVFKVTLSDPMAPLELSWFCT